MNKEKKNGYWFSPCINCGQMPTVEDTELCGPCCFGEADSIWDWLWEDWKGCKKASKYASKLLKEANDAGLKYISDIENRLKEIVKEGKDGQKD